MRLNTIPLFLFVTLFASVCCADTSIQAIALFDDKAMLSINGKRAKIIKIGQTIQGVTLLEADTSAALIDVDGQQQELTLNSGLVLTRSLGASAVNSNQNSAVLWADEMGFFRGEGAVNGERLEFLVDTGASIVVLSSRHADRVGFEYRKGQRTFASTASGTAPMFSLEARSLIFEGIEVNNVEVGVIEGSYPQIPLLGMTFLEQLDMNRSGNKMELKKRY